MRSYLADDKCTRLGVIFPGSGALPRLVASSLERLEIPHNDGLGHIVPGISNRRVAGLDRIATRPTTQFFSAFCKRVARSGGRITQNQPTSFRKDSARKLQRGVAGRSRTACANSVPRAWTTKSQSAAEALRALPFLPPRATLAQFLEQTHAALPISTGSNTRSNCQCRV